MRLEVVCTQHSGKKYRTQQDALWDSRACFQHSDLPTRSDILDAQRVLLAVADGVSVSPSPQLASRFVIESLARFHASCPDLDARLVRKVHGELCDRYAKGKTYGTSTTLAAVQIERQRCIAVNVGDSRAYLIPGSGEWRRLSRDHTVLNRLIDEGQARPEESYAEIYDGLEHCLIADDGEVDFPVHRSETSFLPGDTLLLCTDGVHDCLGEAALKQLFDGNRSIFQQAQIWRHAILDAGAPDNFSFILAKSLPAARDAANNDSLLNLSLEDPQNADKNSSRS